MSFIMLGSKTYTEWFVAVVRGLRTATLATAVVSGLMDIEEEQDGHHTNESVAATTTLPTGKGFLEVNMLAS